MLILHVIRKKSPLSLVSAKFIDDIDDSSCYRNISAPLIKLLKAESPEKIEVKTSDQDSAFHTIIGAVTSPPILSLPRNLLTISVDTDASDYQVGAALFQADEEGVRRPLGYFSITLNVHEENYHVTENEFLAEVWEISTLRPCLLF